MEKLSKILVVAQGPDTSRVLLDKAVALARRFGAHIDLMLADPTTVSAFATRCAELGCDDIVSYVLHCSSESLAEVLARRLREQPVDLVMKHFSRPRALRLLPGGMGDGEIVACSGIPVMLVSEQPWRGEPRFAAAVDVGEPDAEVTARTIVHTAGLIAMGCEASLEVLYCEREQRDERVRTERAVRLARLVREFRVGCEHLRLAEGPPERTLPAIVAERAYDVLVLGAVPRHRTLFPSLYSLTSQLIHATSGDVLLVDLPQAALQDASVRQRVAVHP